MDATIAAAETGKGARLLLAKHIREQHPWLKDAALDSLLDATITTMEHGLLEQQGAMDATREKISFFSLSTELRNRVYQLVLEPDDAAKPQHVVLLATRSRWWSSPGPHLVDISRPSVLPPMVPPLCVAPGSFKLLLVSKAVRDEVKPMFWGGKIFLVNYKGIDPPAERARKVAPTKKFLETIGYENAALIRNFVLVAEDCSRDEFVEPTDVTLRTMGMEGLGLHDSALSNEYISKAHQNLGVRW